MHYDINCCPVHFICPPLEELTRRRFIEKDAVRVAQCSIPAIGRSVYTTRAVRQGAHVCSYGGRVRVLPESNSYTVGCILVCIDASDEDDAGEHVGHLINDPYGPLCYPDGTRAEPNVAFAGTYLPTIDIVSKCGQSHRPFVTIVALRDLRAGEELWVEYGEGYWRAHAKREAANPIVL